MLSCQHPAMLFAQHLGGIAASNTKSPISSTPSCALTACHTSRLSGSDPGRLQRSPRTAKSHPNGATP
eukprot:5378051-Amphidinium_carterae.1